MEHEIKVESMGSGIESLVTARSCIEGIGYTKLSAGRAIARKSIEPANDTYFWELLQPRVHRSEKGGQAAGTPCLDHNRISTLPG